MITISPLALISALRWIQQTPNLFSGEISPLLVERATPSVVPLLEPDTQSLQRLAEALSHTTYIRLGIYYEQLWHFILQNAPEYRLLAHNLPVRNPVGGNKTTLGEFDLIYQYQGDIYHRELAVKFYLGLPVTDSGLSCSPLNHWVGSGLGDRLDKKVERMFNHQITLSDREEGGDALRGIDINLSEEGIRKEVLIQGRLFYPLHGACRKLGMDTLHSVT